MKGFVVAEQGHVVNIIPPVDNTGGKISQAFSMRDYQHATIIFQIGVAAAAGVTLKLQCGTATALGGTNVAGATPIGFKLYRQETAGANFDVLGPGVIVPSTGYVVPAGNSIFYVIELDGQELPQGSPWVQLVTVNGANSVIGSAVAVLSGARFAEVQSPTETA